MPALLFADPIASTLLTHTDSLIPTTFLPFHGISTGIDALLQHYRR